MDFILTIDSDNENGTTKRSKRSRDEIEEVQLDPDFQFDLPGDLYTDILQSEQVEDIAGNASKKGTVSDCW